MKNSLITTAALLVTIAMMTPANAGGTKKLTARQKTKFKAQLKRLVSQPQSRVGQRVYHNPVSHTPHQPVIQRIQYKPQTRCQIITNRGTFSPRLGARVEIQQVFLPQFGTFTAARIVSEPVWGSPLRELGLQNGDVITRLDGVRTTWLGEMENHYAHTDVRYIKAGTTQVRNGSIHIQPNRLFQDPTTGHGQIGQAWSDSGLVP